MKAVAIIKMPNCCRECPFADWDQCLCKLANEEIYSQKHMDDGRQKWCPLKPLPQKGFGDADDIEQTFYFDGWNECLEEIMGETE